MSDNYEDKSKDRLKTIAEKKLRTVMIGALAIIEDCLDLSDLELRETYEQLIRPKILDLGNNQMRNMKTEIDMYTVSWNRYQYKFEVKERKE